MISKFPGFNANLVLCLGLTLLLSSISSRNRSMRALFALLAIYFNVRYVNWRLATTLAPFDAGLGALWQWALFWAEMLSVLLLSWHFLVLIPRPTPPPDVDRPPPPSARGGTPSVDVFIATYNEGAELLRATIAAATRLDYEAFTVWVLDDGARDWLRTHCEEVGVRYLARTSREGFKAGNLNHALTHATGEYILCLDADFVVKPRFLRRTLGYFHDPRVALVQTPQHFWNPDAPQLNLGGEAAWPEDQRVFTDVIQPSRDVWDNAFCYGSNFVVRRACLDAIGGFPTQTICEDLFLSYVLKGKGWITRYHDEELALGLAADTLNEFLKQRMRWCTGTLQCLFLRGGPILSRELSLVDRLFFLDPVLFYLSNVWFFVLLVSPAVFWWTGVPPFHSTHGHVLTMLLPRMFLSMLVMYWLTDRKVVPVASEIGRNTGIFYMVATILTTLASPFDRTFDVTLKNTARTSTTVNWKVLAPHALVMVLTLAGVAYNGSLRAAGAWGWDDDFGLMLALTVYACWVHFLSLLTCVEPVLRRDPSLGPPPTADGSIVGMVGALARKVAQ